VQEDLREFEDEHGISTVEELAFLFRPALY
jgi:hypothetical protein